MPISVNDVTPLSQGRTGLSERADQVKAGAEKIRANDDAHCVALIDAQHLACNHALECNIHLVLLDDAKQGLADIAAGHVQDARSMLGAITSRRAVKAI